MTEGAPGDPTGPTRPRVLLASGSPRRLELLVSAGIEPEVRVPDVDETPLVGEDPTDYVARVARCKAMAVEPGPGVVVVAADTTVDIDGRILAKPAGAQAAASMLAALAGRVHLVHTAVAVRRGGRCEVFVVTTRVEMADFGSDIVAWYVGTGEPLDKAGAYAIQGHGARLVAAVDGSVSNVIGLPLVETLEALADIGGPGWGPCS